MSATWKEGEDGGRAGEVSEDRSVIGETANVRVSRSIC